MGDQEQNTIFDDIRRLSSQLSIDIKVIFDVGSYIGTFSLETSGHFPEAVIHSFEPFIESYEAQLLNVEGNTRIICHNHALGDVSYDMKYYCNKKSFTNSLLPNADNVEQYISYGMHDPVSSHEVPVKTIAQFLEEKQIERIDVLKMDTQGYEYRVLQGAAEFLSTDSIPFIYSEVLFVPLYKGQVNFENLRLFLVAKGYRLFSFYNEHKDEDGNVKWADALFIPEMSH